MSYSNFTQEKVKQSFGLTIVENTVLFPDITPQQPSQLLTQWLKEYVSLAVAINTEKAQERVSHCPRTWGSSQVGWLRLIITSMMWQEF